MFFQTGYTVSNYIFRIIDAYMSVISLLCYSKLIIVYNLRAFRIFVCSGIEEYW